MRLSARRCLEIAVLASLLCACGDDDGGDGALDAGTLDAGAADAGAADAGTADADTVGDDDAGSDAGAPTRVDGLLDEISAAQCAAIFRCCDDAAIEEFFSQYRAFPGLPSPFTDLQDRLPPDATLDATSCVGLMLDLNAIAPFGRWLDAVQEGEVTLDEDALDACLATLETAECGAELEAALYDTGCFAYQGHSDPTGPRTVVHTFFARSAAAGASCHGLEEPSGEPYGTCDPDAAFCCVNEAGSTDCTTAAGEGTCAAVADLGETCSEWPALPCRPGLVCRPGAGIEDPSTCVEPPTDPIANGERCVDDLYLPTGVCSDGFCNAEGTCEAHRADGAACDEDKQCDTGNCAGDFESRTCTAPTFCVGAE